MSEQNPKGTAGRVLAESIADARRRAKLRKRIPALQNDLAKASGIAEVLETAATVRRKPTLSEAIADLERAGRSLQKALHERK